MIQDVSWILIIGFCLKADYQANRQQPCAVCSSIASQPRDTGTPSTNRSGVRSSRMPKSGTDAKICSATNISNMPVCCHRLCVTGENSRQIVYLMRHTYWKSTAISGIHVDLSKTLKYGLDGVLTAKTTMNSLLLSLISMYVTYGWHFSLTLIFFACVCI